MDDFYVDGYVLKKPPGACGCGEAVFRRVREYHGGDSVDPAWECAACGNVYDGL
ncbi:hypothetical protein [Streptomyces sp. NPDC020965]|uniref:hypothetical protein n=1 Tax=Streptomyces sp. NPDC020965 TaxID=3365105 RepID=UPI0037AD8132